MRTPISVILLSCLTLRGHTAPAIRTGAIPSWVTITHSDTNRQPALEEISNGYYYELQDQQTNLLLETEYFHTIRHLVNRSGVQNGSEVSVSYAPQYQEVVFHRICVFRNGATIDELHSGHVSIVEEEPDEGTFQYSGKKRAFFTLADTREGDRIDVAYSIVGFNPVFHGKYATLQYFTRSTAVCNYFRTIITSADRPLSFVARNDAPLPGRQTAGGRLIYCWANPVLREESNPLAGEGNLPFVQITEYKDWREVAGWALNTFDHYRYALPPGLLGKIAAWRRTAAGSTDLFANLATRFVQNEIRYLAIEAGASSLRPHSPAEVLSRAYGDCKDKTLLLVSILRHEGIPAFAALVSADDGKSLPGSAPSPGLFDHVIVAIQRPGDRWLYVDPTLAAQRGELSELYVPGYGYALLVRDGEDSLRTVRPGQASYSILEQLDARFDDTCQLLVTTTFGGGAADKVRRSFDENSRKDIEAGYVRYYAAWIPCIKMAAPVRYEDDSMANRITMRESYAVPTIWATDRGGRRSFVYFVKMIGDNLPDPALTASRSSVPIGHPMQIQYTLQLKLPGDWDFGAGPLHIRNAAFRFDFTPEYADREMTLHYALATFADHIDGDDLHRYREEYKDIDDRISFTLFQDNSSPDLAPALRPDAGARNTAESRHSARPCWPAVWLTFFYAVLFFRLFTWLNARDAHPRPGTAPSPGANAHSLSGWLLVLGLCIGLGFTLDAWQLFRANYYSYENWNAWSAAGGEGLQWLYLGQLAIQLNFVAGAGAITYWYLRKRDIFPSMFVGYAAIVLIGRLVLIGMFYSLSLPAALGPYRADLPWAFIRTSVYAGIWITYVLRSGQVRNTFLVGFRKA